jgi:membrane protease YdiL (CAAX protease family)
LINSAAVESAAPAKQSSVLDDKKRLRCLEVCLVTLVAFGSPLLNSLYVLKYGPYLSKQMSGLGSLALAVHEGTALLLVGYVLSRRGRRLRDLGLHWSLKDVGLGLVVATTSLVSYWLGAYGIQGLHHVIYGTQAMGYPARAFFGHPSLVAALPSVLLNPFFEELIVRAYLMTEVLELTGSATLAVALSVGIQAVYHLYYGWWFAVVMAFQFLIFALYYARWRRALPIVVAHGLFDLYGFLRLL